MNPSGNFEDSLGVSVRVGVMDSIPKKLSRDLVRIANKDHGAKITVHEESLSSLISKLENHEIDIILANERPPTEGKKAKLHAKLVESFQSSSSQLRKICF